MNGSSSQPVQVWEETVVIPTYPAAAADLNPMFLEKRVYQGSSGKVYPNPFTDRISDEKRDRTYRAVFLENEYIRVMVLPEIGGRIHRGFDKTNNYDFFYYQHVIKPALVGLLGPWISGGVEFNWPQHHRPSTFMPVDHCIERHADGSATVWLSEHEPMNRMRGMHGVRLYPGKALVEVRVRCYNRTSLVQTFLWWANAAVHVHEQYQAFFPPDVTWVADHAKRAVSEFPNARGVYYGVDYTRGVDIRWWGNIPVPTSYMVMHSDYNFAGGYDHRRRAGVVHVADRFIAPGKKVWTWGCSEFGTSWERELTDDDGPYFELMAGVFTDNQPDFSWLHPLESRTFEQCWYPIQEIGVPKNANRNGALSLDVEAGRARIGVYVTERQVAARVSLTQVAGQELFTKIVDLAPGAPLVVEVTLPAVGTASGLVLLVSDQSGDELIRYVAKEPVRGPAPSPATEPPPPREISSTDELYVVGLHLEQYRHATRSPRPYWEEALRRDPGDSRNNNALGLFELRRGRFAEAQAHFVHAIARLTERNPNPYDGEPLYNLGVALKFQGKWGEAYEAFNKAAWNHSWQTASHFALAQIDCTRGEKGAAIDHLRHSLDRDPQNSKVRNLKAALLRRLGRFAEAESCAHETVALDPLDFWSRNELVLVHRAMRNQSEAGRLLNELSALMRDNVETYLDIAFDYAEAGLFHEATDLLERLDTRSSYPMRFYALGYFCAQQSKHSAADEYYKAASEAPPDYCFPSRLEEMIVLQDAQRANPQDARAFYYLGNLLYDKQRWEDAIRNWERSCELDPEFSIPWRNLGIAYFNVHHNSKRARECFARAFAANPDDPRLLYEMDQLDKRVGLSPAERLRRVEQLVSLVERRDDLTVERATLYNETGQSQKALAVLQSRRFHPWEGGEGLVSGQYVWSHLILGRDALELHEYDEALRHFQAAQHYPANLGEGKHFLTPENHLHYFSGLAHKGLDDVEDARRCFERAAAEQPVLSAMSYYRALAQRELGQENAANRLLEHLLDAAARKRHESVTIDYFATSLPNFLLFEDDLQTRNETDCLFLSGLANLGLGRTAEAEEAFRQALALDANHLGAQQELRRIRSTADASSQLQ